MANQIDISSQIDLVETPDHILPAVAEQIGESSLLVNGARGVRRAWQRGMATAEYAVGILAAVALALVLLRVFTDEGFFSTLLKFVVGLIGKVGGMLP